MNWQTKVLYEFHNLPEHLSRLGHQVVVVDYDDSYKAGGLFSWGTLGTRIFPNAQRAYTDAKITLFRPGQITIPGLSRLTGAATSYIVVRRLIRDSAIDAVLLYSVPTNGIGTIRAAHCAGIPVLFRPLDILHELVPNRWLRLPTLWFEKQVYKRADRIVALTPKLGDYTVRLGARRDCMEVLKPGVDTDVFCPGEPDAQLMEQWGIRPDDLVVLFMGTLFEFSGMDSVLESFGQVVSEIPRWHSGPAPESRRLPRGC